MVRENSFEFAEVFCACSKASLTTNDKNRTAITSNGSIKKPKLRLKRHKSSLGWAYRIYIDGHYMGAGLTRASAREGAKRMLDTAKRRNKPSKI